MDFWKMEKVGKKATNQNLKKQWVECFETAKYLIEEVYGKCENKKYNFFCIDIKKSVIGADTCINWLCDFMNDSEEMAEYFLDKQSGIEIKDFEITDCSCFTFDNFYVDKIWIAFAEKSRVFMKLKPVLEGGSVNFGDFDCIFKLLYNGSVEYLKEKECVIFDLKFFKTKKKK